MSERLCVVMPVYNEEAIIGEVLQSWTDALSALGIDYTVRPYNDGSRDSSLSVMQNFVRQNPMLPVEIKDKPNGGHGHTILTAYRDAVEEGFEWVFQVDSDNEMSPDMFHVLWDSREDYDLLVGTRDGRVQPLARKIVSFVSRCCVRLFYGRNTIWDVNTPYRLMRASAFDSAIRQIPRSTFAPNVILSGIVAMNRLRYFEASVPQRDRTTGEVSIKKWKLLRAAMKSFCQTVSFSFSAACKTGR